MQTLAARYANPRVLLALALVVGVLGMQAGRGTLAYFTDTAQSTGNNFTAGTIDLELTDADQTTLDSVSSSITANVATDEWRPDQSKYGFITVKNAGNLDATWGVSYTAADTGTQIDGVTAATLTQFLDLTVATGGTTAQCNATDFAANFTTALVTAEALTTAGDTLLADTSQNIAAGASTVLCLKVDFTNGAAGVENAAMGGTSALSFTFTARQEP